jgi:hypothetical protein
LYASQVYFDLRGPDVQPFQAVHGNPGYRRQSQVKKESGSCRINRYPTLAW